MTSEFLRQLRGNSNYTYHLSCHTVGDARTEIKLKIDGSTTINRAASELDGW